MRKEITASGSPPIWPLRLVWPALFQGARGLWRNAWAVAAACFSISAIAMASAGVAGSGDIVPPGSVSKLDATSRVGSWIWAVKTFDGQTCRFWRSFEIPSGASVVKARLRITADNSYWVFLDGLALGRGSEWKTLAQHDLTQVLGPGVHVLAVEAFNDYASAGLLVGLRIGLRDGRLIEVASDDSWRIAPDNERRWNTRRSAATHWPAAKAGGGQRLLLASDALRFAYPSAGIKVGRGEKFVAGLFAGLFHPQPVEQLALGLLLAERDFDQAPNEGGRFLTCGRTNL